ncbi:MAG: type II toxin-antitoxin system VapC family toxin [Microcystis wesenbergii Mw_QC_S_20081001_S30D]|jgi:predicted nucleic acid-binding protein|uniref:Type II toxin-antitoxin system VapC family toxin n=1 Tax=Microcystis wesenbergii Mw_QC_S_20081001_S30D TaxID=2486245 RepID=A0A552JME4_9CHRO|nr:type II toxin-antitoxin system VapC family toxin [Microcystis aeruginosa W11-03]NCR92965.1 type II toxin-antitoxin system VapC family toxin [Microcystis aeruginosa W11-06]TRU94515.1 MAG: type II toxin-antitoxin system VapC family toxin [Microcystis wesenbergii Mw_QC_B_20070930_S4D]TRU96943.1 MAG: type II toxin-antitoxin system VapC family toxin [Microcystis wesenbergii Mw_QC_S_20081001_S30D]TRU97122.1 MAG: type II toxin-antitoxin system VapC family toxin [Microcystis wesenbergii Mw_QC_S_2008
MEKPLVFLDTDVLASYLRGDLASVHLFDREILDRLRLALNALVLQELLFLAAVRNHPEIVDRIQEKVTILDFDLVKLDQYWQNARNIRNILVQLNDVLILSIAANCDYLVTYDQQLKKASSYLSNSKPIVVTSEELLEVIHQENILPSSLYYKSSNFHLNKVI